ncbi:MAG: hypothetical protein BZ138_06655, partial [Methanosphaera sp. rholeuAM270]
LATAFANGDDYSPNSPLYSLAARPCSAEDDVGELADIAKDAAPEVVESAFQDSLATTVMQLRAIDAAEPLELRSHRELEYLLYSLAGRTEKAVKALSGEPASTPLYR